MTPIEIASTLRTEGKEQMALGVERMLFALRIAAKNCWGDGIDAFKPMSVEFGHQIGDLCAAAANGDPHEKLDAVMASAKR